MGAFEDRAEPGRLLESFLVESWLEHLRQHERVTHADGVPEEKFQGLLRGKPKVTHLITTARGVCCEFCRSLPIHGGPDQASSFVA